MLMWCSVEGFVAIQNLVTCSTAIAYLKITDWFDLGAVLVVHHGCCMLAVEHYLGDIWVLQYDVQHPCNPLQVVLGDTWPKIELVHCVLNDYLHSLQLYQHHHKCYTVGNRIRVACHRVYSKVCSRQETVYCEHIT